MSKKFGVWSSTDMTLLSQSWGFGVCLIVVVFSLTFASAIPQTFNVHTHSGHENLQAGGWLTDSGDAPLEEGYLMEVLV